ncbi:uncharacterized protein FIBRA_06478 [Fibroporia radiculosa]|uniref:Uncharacterized protein n=1 Tax=Fibroporia radiculosa TaxID=599839 RepID=J4HZ63_9APHY|nr:uncharacterized protein FIBRA_06478 [Fibroporia radiculosa]CCM04307.1 predicted protein [Fibroporia radiculosa]
MAPKNKAKAAGVSASSFFDLKAELAKQEEEFTKNKAAGKASALVGGIKRPDKKPTVWARQNAGVKARAARDIELEEISKPTLDSARAVLERKAKIYEKLRKGKSGGLSEKQYDALLVDFEQMPIDPYESDSDDEDESLTVPKAPDGGNDDPVIEYEDEFGRIRTAPRSEVPRHLLPKSEEEQEEDIDPFVIYNPVDHFPVYEPSAERVAAIEAEFAEENNPLNVHFDASREVRAKGAGFYQFSADEETRRKQMEDLRRAREETEKTRAELGAADARPGETEGMRAPGDKGEGSAAVGARSRATEKRKRELEERRKLLDAKRRKQGGPERAESHESSEAQARPSPPAQSAQEPASVPVDPFAALEARSSSQKGKMKERPERTADEADVFLSQLEKEMIKGGKVRR